MKEKYRKKLDSWFGEGDYKVLHYNDVEDFTGTIITEGPSNGVRIEFIRMFEIGGEIQISQDREITVNSVADLESAPAAKNSGAFRED